MLHLGLGSFFRAHQAWYTEHAPDRADWGHAAFAGRGGYLAARLDRQEGLYTLITRAADADRHEVIGSLARAHAADDHAAWLGYHASPKVALVTLTVTEAGYLRRADGSLDTENPLLQQDIAALQADPLAPVRTVPARLVAGLAARRGADAGPLAIVPCDNMAGNGAATSRVVSELAELVDPSLREWAAAMVSFISTTVDRITPKTQPDDTDALTPATGWRDECPVVTEPFSEWVIQERASRSGFPAGRPRWEEAGAVVTEDVTPYENRKLWMLNGAHSLLAYAGSIRGHGTVAEAIGDGTCRSWVEQWWAVAGPHLAQPVDAVEAYCEALLERWTNPRIRHHLAQIAADGSQKLPIRILPVLRAERARGRIPLAATRILAAWVCHLRGLGAPVADVRASALIAAASGPALHATRRLLQELDAALADDGELVQVIAEQVGELAASAG
jgi:fructuronate reductase